MGDFVETLNRLAAEAGSAAIQVYRDKNTAPIADRSIDTQGVPLDQQAGGMNWQPWIIGGGVLLAVVMVISVLRK